MAPMDMSAKVTRAETGRTRRGWAVSVLFASVLPGCSAEVPESLVDRPGQSDQVQQFAADTNGENVYTDAPWRVQSGDTPIPFQVVITDACANLALDSVQLDIWDGVSAWIPFYFRNYGGENIGWNPSLNQFLVIDIRRLYGYGGYPDGESITSDALLQTNMAGSDIYFRSTVTAPGCLFGPSYGNVLKVHIGDAPLPHGHGRFSDWRAGDLHAHTMYTNNPAEFGLPHKSLRAAGVALGLDWVITTDHSCDLDPPTLYSSQVDQWAYCEEVGSPNVVCTPSDHSLWPMSSTRGWAMAVDDASAANTWAMGGAPFNIMTGEEVNLLSDSGKTIHALVFRSSYVPSEGSGFTKLNVPLDAVDLNIPGLAQRLSSTALVFSAHPRQKLQDSINGGAWEEEDVAAALDIPAYRGFQVWNMRATATAESSLHGEVNPFPEWTACTQGTPECYPGFLADEIGRWNQWLSTQISSEALDPRLFIVGGSDAHGDLNYQTSWEWDPLEPNRISDNAFGKVRTVVLAAGSTEEDVVGALGVGRNVITDGPMMTIGFDGTGDGTIDDLTNDGQVGSAWLLLDTEDLDLHVKWQTTEEFGEIDYVQLYRGTKNTGGTPDVADVLAMGGCVAADRMSAECVISLSHTGQLALPPQGETYYYYARAWTDYLESDGGHRVITNPIWITGATCTDSDNDGYGDYSGGSDCALFGIPEDCDDGYATCTTTCVDMDQDGTPDCGDGCIDNDKDGYGTPGGAPSSCLGTDCNDANAVVHPGATEVCNNVDDNCSGTADEGVPSGPACGLSDVSPCHKGTMQCQAGQMVCAGAVDPTPEICNGIDDDCNGSVDDGVCGSDAGVDAANDADSGDAGAGGAAGAGGTVGEDSGANLDANDSGEDGSSGAGGSAGTSGASGTGAAGSAGSGGSTAGSGGAGGSGGSGGNGGSSGVGGTAGTGGSTGGSTGSIDSGTSGGGASEGVPPVSEGSKDDGGCACRSARLQSEGNSPLGFAMVLAVAVATRRRRGVGR